MPMWDTASMTPGMTYLPVASTTSAPAGTCTLAPTPTILPPRMTTVPLGIAGPLMGSTVPPRIAIARSCANTEVDRTRSEVVSDTSGVNDVRRMLLRLLRGGAIVDHLSVADHEVDPRFRLVPRPVEDHEVSVLADGNA